jgi:hypothetical protein
MRLPFRQIHMDFHTSPDIENVAAAFDPEEFARTLEEARVESVTCFARCHHGYLYYDSKAFSERVHPRLANRNLLRDQIVACHKRGIKVPIYTTVQFDHFTARQHPEWLAVTEHGRPFGLFANENGEYLGAGPFDAGFYRRLCINTPYRDLLKDMVSDILETLPIDGLFLDIVWETDCCCESCKDGMERRGFDPLKLSDRRAFNLLVINGFIKEMTSHIRSLRADCSIYYNNGAVRPGNRDGLEGFTHLELDCLPGARPDGYMMFKTTALFARTLGLECVGQTGRFHTDWGDLHSFKNKEALEYECNHSLAIGAKCSIGDQLDPSGRVDKRVYSLIGSIYSEVEMKEPWCRNAQPLAEIGVLSTVEFDRGQDSLIGAVRVLQEGGHQIDILDSRSDFSQYKVLVMPDSIPFDAPLAAKVERYISNGGAMIASFESGMDRNSENFTTPTMGVRLNGNGPVDRYGNTVRGRIFSNSDYADYIIPVGAIGAGLPATDHVMYMKGTTVEALQGTEVLAAVVEPYFYRTYRHFHSHRQAPSSGKIGGAGIVKNGNVIYFAHPIFNMYAQFAPKWCKKMILNALDVLLPEPLLRHDGPSTLQAYLNRQTKANRAILHLLHYIPQRKSKFLEIIEDIIPLHDVKVSVLAPGKIKRVACVPENRPLAFTEKDGRVSFIVPIILGHQIISIES